LFAAEKGFLKDIELNKILDFEAALHSYMNNEQAELMKMINETGNYNDDIESQLKTAFDTFKSTQTW
jgi:F-type H+-transporting ATPase subunit alpha